jgi:hypothetical protein
MKPTAQAVGKKRNADKPQRGERGFESPNGRTRVRRTSQNGTARVGHDDNPNVLKILPVTTLRTIDLQGKKISGPLFSIFCVDREFFFN